MLTKNGSDAVKLSVRRMCKADLLAVAQLEKECLQRHGQKMRWQKVLQKQIMYFCRSGIEAVLHGR